MRLRVAAIGLLAAIVTPAIAADMELEFTEDALNRLVSRLGDPSDGGIFQPSITLPGFAECYFIGYLDCPVVSDVPSSPLLPLPVGRIPLVLCKRHASTVLPSAAPTSWQILPSAAPTSWQWWITRARFNIKASSLEFSASVRYRIGEKWSRVDRTVPATIQVNTVDQAIRVAVSSFRVPIGLDPNRPFIQVDVGRLMSFSIPITGQSVQVARLSGGTKTIRSRADGATVQYLYPEKKVLVNVNVRFY